MALVHTVVPATLATSRRVEMIGVNEVKRERDGPAGDAEAVARRKQHVDVVSEKPQLVGSRRRSPGIVSGALPAALASV